MSGFDQGGIFFSDQSANNGVGLSGSHSSGGEYLPTVAALKYREFLRNFRLEDDYIYRNLLRSAIGLKQYLIEVDIDHLMMFDAKLGNELLRHPSHHLPLFEKAAIDAAIMSSLTTEEEAEEDLQNIQVTLTSSKQPIKIRQMLASEVAHIVTIPGIVIATSKVKAKGTEITAQCASCQHVDKFPVRAGFSSATLPRQCTRVHQENEAKCSLDPFVILPERCKYVDQQTWKLQEAPEQVPTGEMPRSIMLTVDRRLVDRAHPGDRVQVTGIMSIMTQSAGTGKADAKVAIRTPYLQVLGVRHGFEMRTAEGESLTEFSQQEEEEFRELARDPDIVKRLCMSISPSIFGMDDVKHAIACLLFSGSRKELPDGARLRGDINVLLLGDPSVAKSQFLKFVEKAAPTCVYTSGKGSSAAGLTATVTQEAGSRDFYLEGGAMVLADGGVVCIDEFDKMREQDRVAIHEAMEQQTISIAKAGITTTLNSRTSVLAAANPVHGRYHDEKNAAEQVDFQTTILSRFDMIFVLRDKHDGEFDSRLAKHIIGVHVKGGAIEERELNEDELDVRTLRRYIAFARKHCQPRLSNEAAELLSNYYVEVRSNLAEGDKDGEAKGRPPRAVPITVRQLEALVRIAESHAKMRLDPVATESDVREAIELFTISTLQAAKMGEIELEGASAEGMDQARQRVMNSLGFGQTTSRQALLNQLVGSGMDESTVYKAIKSLVGERIFEESRGGKALKRIG